jgi:hypothetical protein
MSDPLYLQLDGATALLGPRTPLPALYEEVLRDWRGFAVGTRRFTTAKALLRACDPAALAAAVADDACPDDARLLAAILLAMAGQRPWRVAWPTTPPRDGADPVWVRAALAWLPYPDPDGRFSELLAARLVDAVPDPGNDSLPEPLLLLAFLKGLRDGTLSDIDFAQSVLAGRVLHPGVASSRPLRALHPLLDYLGLSQREEVGSAYRGLAAQVWPHAAADNWHAWGWITHPGGPELFPQTLDALAQTAPELPALHALKHAPLPPRELLPRYLSDVPPAVTTLLGWLRGVPGREALRWLTAANREAAATASARPPWWEAWLRDGLPAARTALTWLQAATLPPGVERHRFLETYYVPAYRRICANLLLARAATGEVDEELLTLADAGDLAALRALAMVPAPGDAVYVRLRAAAQRGSRPAREAATAALEHLARRQGLPDAVELDRQHLLAAAWEPGPLGGARVQVGWPVGGYLMRVGLHAGAVRLEVLGPLGPVTRVPEVVRRSDAYAQARAAQRGTQAQYRTFKGHLEHALLNATPFTTGEFRYLLANPIFAHLAERLVWQTPDGVGVAWAGPERWETVDGTPVDLADVLTLALAHPVLLARDGVLTAWQTRAADHRLVQPFRQLFREVYVADGAAGTRCERFAGRRIAPAKAYAVLRAAGFAPGSGVARRDWPGGITAHLCWAEGAAGRDLFGPHRQAEARTGAVWFTHHGDELPLSDVAPILFSETLRVADLVTTVAAAGDAALTSRETVALRAALLRQMARSFQLTNLATPETGGYAIVLGTRATYRVNLTSGTVLLEPEGRQVVVPHLPARWSPSEDHDATTEILALILALCHDEEITDLAFLAQLGA